MDINYLLALQEFRNGSGAILTDFMLKMTFLGEMSTALVILAVVYWCISKKIGTYLFMGWCGNRLVNGALKVTVCAYRPWIRDPAIIPHGDSMKSATGYSFPSGHSMNAASVYGGMAVRDDMTLASRAPMAVVVALVAFSRNFLGVHTPQDILVGVLAGTLVMWLTLKLMRWLDAHPEKDRLVILIGVALAVAVALYAGFKQYPVDFDEQGKLIVDGAKMANDTFKGVGWCMAFLIGWGLERRYVQFSTDVPDKVKVARLAMGLFGYYAVSLILAPLLKSWIPGPAGTLISCFCQMFYVSFLFPWCFKRVEERLDRKELQLT